MNNDHSKARKIKDVASVTLDVTNVPLARNNAAWGSIEQTIVDALVDQIVLLTASVEGYSLSSHSIWLRIYRTAGVLEHAHLRRSHLTHVEQYLRHWVIRLRQQLPPTARSPGWRRNMIGRIVRRATELGFEQRLAELLRSCQAINTEDLTDPQIEAVFSAVASWHARTQAVA